MKTKNYGKISNKKNVSYMPLPTQYGYEDTDEKNDPENRSNLDHCTVLKLNTGAACISTNLTESSLSCEQEELQRHEKTARTRLLMLSGHRRAESLGSVGQSSRNMVTSPDFVPVENHGDCNGKTRSKF